MDALIRNLRVGTKIKVNAGESQWYYRIASEAGPAAHCDLMFDKKPQAKYIALAKSKLPPIQPAPTP